MGHISCHQSFMSHIRVYCIFQKCSPVATGSRLKSDQKGSEDFIQFIMSQDRVSFIFQSVPGWPPVSGSEVIR